MSSAPCAPALKLELRPSRRLAALVLVLHAAALLGLILPSLAPVGLRLLIGVAVMVSLRRAWRRARLQGPRAILSLGWSDTAGWWYQRREGGVQAAELLPDSVVVPGLAVLRLRAGPDTHVVVIPSDGASSEAARRLRVHLRHGRAGPGRAPAAVD